MFILGLGSVLPGKVNILVYDGLTASLVITILRLEFKPGQVLENDDVRFHVDSRKMKGSIVILP